MLPHIRPWGNCRYPREWTHSFYFEAWAHLPCNGRTHCHTEWRLPPIWAWALLQPSWLEEVGSLPSGESNLSWLGCRSLFLGRLLDLLELFSWSKPSASFENCPHQLCWSWALSTDFETEAEWIGGSHHLWRPSNRCQFRSRCFEHASRCRWGPGWSGKTLLDWVKSDLLIVIIRRQ